MTTMMRVAPAFLQHSHQIYVWSRLVLGIDVSGGIRIALTIVVLSSHDPSLFSGPNTVPFVSVLHTFKSRSGFRC